MQHRRSSTFGYAVLQYFYTIFSNVTCRRMERDFVIDFQKITSFQHRTHRMLYCFANL